MAGVISVIQLIHYPCFVHIDRGQFSGFHLQHSKVLGLIAGPAMCIELLSAVWLARNGSLIFVVNLAAVITLWCLTFFVSVPAHNLLASGFQEKAWQRLVSTNWIRTALWGLRAVLFATGLVMMTGAST